MVTSTSSDAVPGDGLPDSPEHSRAGRSALEWVAVIAGAVLVALVIKTFAVQAFYIPSESMEPTLFTNDRVLVNKVSYRLHDVRRGDVIVFESPPGEVATDIKDLIKRVVGLPGESIYFKDGRVYVNDRLLDEPYLPADTHTDEAHGPRAWSHACRVDDPCVVPPHAVWVMGDNRSNSQDSRYIGPIDQDLIVGRAFVIVWPFNRLGGL